MGFKEQLAKLRKRKNITQIELASKMNVKQYIISSWETGRSEPSIKQLMLLSDILDVPTDYLLDKQAIKVYSDEEFYKVIENIRQDADNDFLKAIEESCSNLNEEKKKKMLAIIKELSEFKKKNR